MTNRSDTTDPAAPHTGAPGPNFSTNGHAATETNPFAGLIDVALRYGSACANAGSASHTATEADEELRRADCDALDAVNKSWETLLTNPGADNEMGFTSEIQPSSNETLTAANRLSELAKLAYQQRRSAAMRAEIEADRTRLEAEAAEQELLTIARSLSRDGPADGRFTS